MKKFAICCLALVAVAVMVPTAQAGTKCWHLTNFCDGVQTTTNTVDTLSGTLQAGLWDWVCLHGGTGSLMAGRGTTFGTQPLYPYSGGTGSGFDALFVFKTVNFVKEFDLWATADGMTFFSFQTSQPWTATAGPCPNLVGQKNLPKATVVQ